MLRQSAGADRKGRLKKHKVTKSDTASSNTGQGRVVRQISIDQQTGQPVVERVGDGPDLKDVDLMLRVH